jgi:hypothetical protein
MPTRRSARKSARRSARKSVRRSVRKSARKSATKRRSARRSASCVRQTTKNYTSRASPPYKAKDCKGSLMRGNDGHPWNSKRDTNGVYRWVRGNSLDMIRIGY